jgi:cystathionine beta-lyase family protein involved in aluminum resistance
VLVQRSCGYALRPTLSVDDVARIVHSVKAQAPGCVVAVDNCYGEFTADREPPAVRFGWMRGVCANWHGARQGWARDSAQPSI